MASMMAADLVRLLIEVRGNVITLAFWSTVYKVQRRKPIVRIASKAKPHGENDRALGAAVIRFVGRDPLKHSKI